MAKGKKRTRAKTSKQTHVPVEMRDRLDTIIAVIQTVAGALADDEHGAEANVLFECAALPLIEIRDKLEKAR